MIPFLAQQTLDPLPATFWKDFCIALLVMLGVSGGIVFIIVSFRKPAPLELSDDPTPTIRIADDPALEVRKASKRYNHELAESRHSEVTRRLDGHDAEIEQLWTTMRAEDARAMTTISNNHSEVMRALGRIEGELKKP